MMRKLVFDYIRDHEGTDLHEIAKALCLDELQVLRIVDALLTDSYIKLDKPKPLNNDNQNSCYYSAAVREFSET